MQAMQCQAGRHNQENIAQKNGSPRYADLVTPEDLMSGEAQVLFFQEKSLNAR